MTALRFVPTGAAALGAWFFVAIAAPVLVAVAVAVASAVAGTMAGGRRPAFSNRLDRFRSQ